jgi:carbon-monoxide dehydrogenase medium subunit
LTDWLAPESLEAALELRAEHGEDVTVLAGGTFLAILMNQGFLAPRRLLSLSRVPGLERIAVVDGELRLGAMVTHRAVERSAAVRGGWPVLAEAFSDPPAVLAALGAGVVLRSARGERTVAASELIRGYYETCIAADELLVEVRVPPSPSRAVYRKFRSRSSEDRPCVAVAAVRGRVGLRVVVGAVADRPQELPEVCALADTSLPDFELAAEIGRRYAEGIEPMSDSRGSADYRRRVIAAEVRRAVEALA